MDPMKRYEKIKAIGKGSYGKVYLYRDKVTKELVVVKAIPIKENDQKAQKMAKKEATVLKMMQHPNVIRYYDSFFNSRHSFCIVLEYADGKDLQKYLESHGELEEKQILLIFAQIILGLDYIHSQGILHRDIKTANVFLFRKGLVKLGDFGISRKVDQYQLAHTLIGTPYFMCPELLRGQKYGFPADIWAAGCVLFELMTRKHAFTGKSREELFSNIMSGQMPQMPTQYSKPLIDLLQSMLQQDPAKRPKTQDILSTPIIAQGLDAIQQRLCKHFSSQKLIIPKAASPAAAVPAVTKPMDDTDDSAIPQNSIPEWLVGDTGGVGEELLRQSNRHLEKDTNRLLGVVRSSISRISMQSIPQVTASPGLTGNLEARKKNLEAEAKLGLGEKYEIAYNFIKENCLERRDQLRAQLNGSHENELKMIETIIAIEELS